MKHAPRAAFAIAMICGALAPAVAGARSPAAPSYEPHVVVATLDTGTNPFHPTWRRPERRHPSAYIPGYPAAAQPARLSFRDDFADSVEASNAALQVIWNRRQNVWIPGTNIIGTWAHPTDHLPVFDARDTDKPSHSHGASASSQIAGRGLGLAPDAYLVVVDRTADGGTDVYKSNAEALRWAADQAWIDVIHTNIQNPLPLANSSSPAGLAGYADAVSYALSKGKVVVSAGGNFYAETTETSPHAGPPGVLVAGANDNCGWTSFSNPDPHVVMDGMGTESASPVGYGTVRFGGTSSASPRISGYVADLILRLRRHFGYRGGIADGALLRLPAGRRPAQGPLADGALTAAELHEVVRKTANPRSHASRWDGTAGLDCVPEPPAGPAFYPKVGYGEVSEHTIDGAFAVAVGKSTMPARPDEDRFYEASERLRTLFWG